MNSLNVVYISNWFENPYKDLLVKHLAEQKVKVTEYFRQLLFLPQVLQQPDIRILHLQTLHYFFVSRNPVYYWFKFIIFIIELYLLKLWGIKVLWTVHEWKDKNSQGKHDLSLLKAKILGRALDGVITHCESTRQEMIEALDLQQAPEKVFVIPHGNYIGYYENSLSRHEARSTLAIAEENIVFLLFGGIHANKGVLEAISAFKQLNKSSITLIIAGEPNNQELRNQILQETQERPEIIFIDPDGYIPDNEVQLYFNACDVVLLPYQVFTTSGVALLAMSFGRACIAPQVGFFSDVFDEQSAFLYPNLLEDGLQTAMETAIKHQKQLKQMGEHSKELAKAVNWDVIAAKTASVYRQVLAKSLGK